MAQEQADEFHIDKNSVDAMLEWMARNNIAFSLKTGLGSMDEIIWIGTIYCEPEMSGMFIRLLDVCRWLVDTAMQLRPQ